MLQNNMEPMQDDSQQELIPQEGLKLRLKKMYDWKNREETTPEQARRNIGQNAARAVETFIGMPGNLKKAYQQTKEYLADSLFGKENALRNAVKDNEINKPEKGGYIDIIMNPPTSSELRETATKNISKRLTGDEEFLEPRNEKEKAAGELTQDLTSFFMPGTGQMRLLTRIAAPVVGNLAKQGLKYIGIEEKSAEKAKLGIMLATTLAGQSNPAQFSKERIGQAKKMVPENMTVNAKPLADNLMPLYNRMTRGLGVPSKSKATQGMKDLASQVESGRIPMKNLMDARDNINEWISEAGGWDVPTNVRDASIRNLNQLKSQIINTIDTNLSSRLPQAAELYKTGYEAAAVTHQSNAISNFIEKNFGRKASSIGAKVLFPSMVGGAAVLPKTVATAAATYPLYKVGQVLYRVGNSPTLARYYMDVIANASAGNAPSMIRSMEKFDKAMKVDEEKKSKGKTQTLQQFKESFKNRG